MIDPKSLPLTRGMVIARILSARTPEGCARARALIEEWTAAFPGDTEVDSYGSFVARMDGALKAQPQDDLE